MVLLIEELLMVQRRIEKWIGNIMVCLNENIEDVVIEGKSEKVDQIYKMCYWFRGNVIDECWGIRIKIEEKELNWRKDKGSMKKTMH